MEDLQLVRELRRESPLPGPTELAGVRHRLTTAMAAEPAGESFVPAPVRRPRRARRFVLAVATAGLAAVIAGVVVMAPDKVGGPTAEAQAAEVLHRAATEALKLPDVPPRPDQFLYVRDSHGVERWLSVNGTRDGLRTEGKDRVVLPGCADGRRSAIKGDRVVGTEACTPEPAYLPDLPRDVDAMLAYLKDNRRGEQGAVNAIAKDIDFLLSDHLVPPQSKAALFRAAAKIPGLKVVKDVKDPAGRPGVGITWSNDGFTNVIVFDEKTYAYLGLRTGTAGSAVVRVAVVNKAGQRP
ncbi:CU044_5270 family protein [Plantactinospora sp. GCM10030261]|uniref:CU044_5270 family protein n=1 Tax=Plantactinospora sp. GCM10030261 TaxID=3273420 RepID=UPI003608A218